MLINKIAKSRAKFPARQDFWTGGTRVVDERMRFVIAVADHKEAFAAVCRRFGVSRRTGTMQALLPAAMKR
jgi:hypothetical protein